MKTLDEVIKAAHHCGLISGFDDDYEYDGGCPYEDCSVCENKRMLGKDVIHYLEEYRDMKNNGKSDYERGFRDGCKKQSNDEEVARRWDESFRSSQMPWNNQYNEMGG